MLSNFDSQYSTFLYAQKFFEKIFSNSAKYAEFECYTAPERRGSAVKEKLCVSERRTRILEFLMQVKQTTRTELSEKFNVSLDTVDRDIVYLSSTAPIYTKQGNQGGVYILPEYRSYNNYLTRKEEQCLYGLMNRANNDERRTLCNIITKFALNTVS